MKHVIEGQIEG